MININKTEISITRGDSAYINFSIYDNSGNVANISPNDVIRCQVRDKNRNGNLLFEGDIQRNNGTIVWHIKPSDTADAEIGTYYWDAQVEYLNGDVFTFIEVSKFNILPEITYDED